MKDYRGIIAIDLDGTLLKDDGTISDFSVSVLKKAQESGYMVLLCSGRPYRAIKETYEAIGSDAPCVCYNGGLIFNPSDPAYPSKSYRFPRHDLEKLFAEAKPYCKGITYEDENDLYQNEEDPFLEQYFPKAGINAHLEEKPCPPFDPYTFIFHFEEESKAKIKELCAPYSSFKFRYWRGAPYGELFIPEADKGNALKIVAKTHSISKNDIYAFGDSVNDKTMLEEAGHPYAMFGGKKALLEAGFPLTLKGNDEDGVALTIESELL